MIKFIDTMQLIVLYSFNGLLTFLVNVWLIKCVKDDNVDLFAILSLVNDYITCKCFPLNHLFTSLMLTVFRSSLLSNRHIIVHVVNLDALIDHCNCSL